MFKEADDKTRGSCHRLLNIWEERGVYGAGFIQAIKQTKDSGSGGGGGGGGTAAGSGSGGSGVTKGRDEIVPILKNSRSAGHKTNNENEKQPRKGRIFPSHFSRKDVVL